MKSFPLTGRRCLPAPMVYCVVALPGCQQALLLLGGPQESRNCISLPPAAVHRRERARRNSSPGTCVGLLVERGVGAGRAPAIRNRSAERENNEDFKVSACRNSSVLDTRANLQPHRLHPACKHPGSSSSRSSCSQSTWTALLCAGMGVSPRVAGLRNGVDCSVARETQASSWRRRAARCRAAVRTSRCRSDLHQMVFRTLARNPQNDLAEAFLQEVPVMNCLEACYAAPPH
jgi:hypothetical protein